MRGCTVALTVLCGVLACAGVTLGQQSPAVRDLAGEWRFAMDRNDAGKTESWFNRDLTDRIRLPGILQNQGYGDEISIDTPWVAALPRSDVPGNPNVLKRWYLLPEYEAYTKPGNVKNPYLSQPKRHYLGVAWYQRDIEIPADWAGKRVQLFLERPRWGISVYVNDREVGSNNSLVAPHEFELGSLTPGRHRLSIRADNRMSVFPGPNAITPGYRPDGHSVTDHVGNTWNGIAGRIELRATSPVYIDDAQVYPNVAGKSALIKVTIGNMTGQAGSGLIAAAGVSAPVTWNATTGEAQLEVRLSDDAPLWDEFAPNLHKLTVTLRGGEGKADDQRELTFGLRQVTHNGRQLLLNGREINLRATHFGGDFPLTGHPPTDVDTWKKIIQVCKDYGLNGMRFHSYCPPNAAFQAADELGFYIQPECGMWNNFSNPGMAQMLEAETQRMMRHYGNHASYILLSPTNEPAGAWTSVLPQWTARWFEKDPRRLYAENTGRVNANSRGPTFATAVIRSTGGWFGRDFSQQVAPWNIPVFGHEVGQWCAYPDFDVIRKFTGYIQPSNFEIYRDSAVAGGVIDRNKEFCRASGKLQLACYKEEIEANLRTPGLGGFHLLDLHDNTGQGGALVGVLDPFWEQKGYCTPQEFRRFCSQTVPLARMTSYVGRTSDPFSIPVEIAHFGEKPLTAAAPYWRIVDMQGTIAAEGTMPPRDIAIGKARLGVITVDISRFTAPRQYKLVVGIKDTPAENDWNFWLYPPQISTEVPADVLVTNVWADAAARLASGGKVLFSPGPNDLGRDSPAMKRTPVFWNRLMNPSAAGDAMLGLWVDHQHPALAGFPTEGFGDWQWIDIVPDVRSVNVNVAPRELRPIVSAIDDWSRNRRLGVLFECKVGTGRLLVSAVNIVNPTRSVAQQLRRSLLDYMATAAFEPRVTLTAQQAAAFWPGPNAGPATRPFVPGANPGDIIEGTPLPRRGG